MKTVTLYEKNDVVWIDISRATKKIPVMRCLIMSVQQES